MTLSGKRRAGKTILVTGATGVLGQALLEKLSDANLLCLVHQTSLRQLPENASTVTGDITAPRLGLSRGTFAKLAARIDCIVHGAAVTNFAAPDDMIHRTNVGGTGHILELAAAAEVPTYYVSTAFVRPGDAKVPNAYVRSKRRAEHVVQTSSLPHTIIRPSIIVGDSQSGAIAQFQGLHLVAGLVLRGALPVVPASPSAYVDFVAQDIVADTIEVLIERDEVGGEYWVTTGDESPSLSRLFDIAVERAIELVGCAVDPPRIVSPDVFDRLIGPVFLPALPSGLRRKFTQALHLSEYMNISEPLPSSLPGLRARVGITSTPEPETVFVRNLKYWASRSKKSKVRLRYG